MTTDMSIFFLVYIPALEHLLPCLPVGGAGGGVRRGQAGTLGLLTGEDGNGRLLDENDYCYTFNSMLKVDESVMGGSTIHALD